MRQQQKPTAAPRIKQMQQQQQAVILTSSRKGGQGARVDNRATLGQTRRGNLCNMLTNEVGSGDCRSRSHARPAMEEQT